MMKTLTANVAEFMRIDGLVITLGGDPSVGSFYTAYKEATFTMSEPERPVLTAEDYPLLAAIWDNEDDAAYDQL